MNATPLCTLAAAAAFAAPTAVLPSAARAAWFDEPVVEATVDPRLDGTDPHYVNLSEDGAYLLVGWHSSNAAYPCEVYSVEELKTLSGAVKGAAMASAVAGDFFGTGSGDGGWKGGAVSATLGVAIPGSGKSSGARYTAFAVPAFGWKADDNAFPVSGLGDAGFDGLDFNAAGTRLYVNQYASGSRNKILAYDTAALKDSHALSLVSEKTVEGVSRIRNLSCYTVKGRDLVYFGEGAVSGSNNSVYVYDPEDGTVTALVTDAALFDDDIMNVKLSHVATGCPTMYVQTDNGRLHVFLLAPDGKSVTSAKPAKSFTPAECAALCGLAGLPANASYVKFRNFEVTDDGDTAFFAFLGGGNSGVTSPGLCVVKSGSTEDAYVSSPNKNNVLFTDYFFGANSRIEVDYAYLDANCYGFVFSPWEAGSGSRSGIWRNNGTYTYFVGNRGSGIASVTLKDTARHTMCIDAPNKKGFIATGATTNEVDFSNYNVTFSTSGWPILFLGSANGSKTAVNATHYARAKIYGAKIYESGVLVRDYVPAIVNGLPCLYDRVGGSVAADTRDGCDPTGFGGNVLRLTGDFYAQLAASGTGADMGINTGYKMRPVSRVEFDCQPTAVTLTGDRRAMGAWNANATFKSLVWINSGALSFFLNSGSPTSTGLKAGTERQTFVMDVPALASSVVKGGAVHKTVVHNVTAPASEAGQPLALFADCNNADGTAFASPAYGMKGYSLKILEDGGTVADFVPSLSLAGACFRDTVGGGEIVPKVPRYFTFRLDPAAGAMEGFVVKTATGNTGLDTGSFLDAKSRAECDFELGATAGNQRLFGCWNNFSSGLKLRCLVWITGGKFQYFLNSGSACGDLAAVDTARHVHVFDIAGGKVRLFTGGTLVGEADGTAASPTDRASIPMSVFADNDAAGVFTGGCQAGARFWGLKRYEDEVLVQDFVPARKDGAIGIADKVSGRFVACGDGFAAGGDLWECAGDAYVETDGTQVLNTGYHAKKSSRIEVDFMPFEDKSVCYFGCYPGNGGAAYTVWNAPSYVCFFMNGGSGDSAGRTRAQGTRLTAVADFSSGREGIRFGGVDMEHLQADFSAHPVADGWTSEFPLGICGGIANASGTAISTTPGAAKMRVYAVRIYEDDALVRLFVPYSGADGVGLADLLTGAKAFKHNASVADPVCVAGPLAITASEVAAVPATGPADIGLGKGTVQTVTAVSPGADAYRWTRNGIAVGETAGGTLDIGWRRGAQPDLFAVTPVYRTAGGAEVLGASSAFTVTYHPEVFVLVVR